MKKLDLVKLINEKPYIENNLQKDMHGIVISENINTIAVLFFNPKNIGNYAIVNVSERDLIIDKEKLQNKIEQEIFSNLDKILEKAKDYLESVVINVFFLCKLVQPRCFNIRPIA